MYNLQRRYLSVIWIVLLRGFQGGDDKEDFDRGPPPDKRSGEGDVETPSKPTPAPAKGNKKKQNKNKAWFMKFLIEIW